MMSEPASLVVTTQPERIFVREKRRVIDGETYVIKYYREAPGAKFSYNSSFGYREITKEVAREQPIKQTLTSS